MAPRRTVTAAASVALCLVSGLAGVQTWPAKTDTRVVPFPAGGSTEVLARAQAKKLHVAIGQPVSVASKPGAGATLGAHSVQRLDGDRDAAARLDAASILNLDEARRLLNYNRAKQPQGLQLRTTAR